MIYIKLYDSYKINNLELLGSGTQGKVYKLDSNKCIKVFKKKEYCKDELHTLLMSQIDVHFPKLFSYGEKYIVREYVHGISLDKYLLANPLDNNISKKIIEIYEAMNLVGFSRLDSALFHIFITPLNEVRLIDTARSMKKNILYPRLILTGLDELGYKDEFLDFVKSKKPELFYLWIKNK